MHAGSVFTKCLADSVYGKYAVSLDKKAVFMYMKAHTDGSDCMKMCEQWNTNIAARTVFFDDTDRKRRYRIRVAFRRIDTIEEAYAETKRVDGVLRSAVIHGLDGVAVDKPSCRRHYEALNGIGTEIIVTRNSSFVAFDPEIIEGTRMNSVFPCPRPRGTRR